MGKNDILITMKTIQDIIELPLILERLSQFAMTPMGKEWTHKSSFFLRDELQDKLNEVDETMRMIARFGSWPIQPSQPLTPTLKAVEKGRMLHVDDLVYLKRDGLMIQALLTYSETLKMPTPSFTAQLKSFHRLDAMYASIAHVLTDRDVLADHASPALASIRRQIKSMDQHMVTLIQKLVQSFKSSLTEPSYSVRNGQYVLPVITSQKQKVSGHIEDVSDTGLTTFIQPQSLVALQQEKQQLIAAEQDEIFRILAEWTDTIRPYCSQLIENNERCGYLDYVHAKARYGITIDGYASELSVQPGLTLKGAKHPLIDPQRVIANDFTLTEKKSMIVISGPNAGGKTVAMKTVGLFVYLHQLAIPLATSAPASISYFEHIYADIGDTQSVLENLSTFAGHITQLVPLTENVKPFDLVLIDELGTGTDPQEGEALARSLLLHLQAKRAFVIVSSHFPGLKTLALEQPRMINASLAFDEVKLTPTYHFMLGLPGKSYGLIMAKRYGLASQVVEHAEKYLKEKQATPEQQHLLRLQDELRDVETMKEQLLSQKQSLDAQQVTLQQTIQQYEQKKASLMESVQTDMAQKTFNVRQQLESVIKQLANPELKLHEAIALKAQLDALTESENEEPIPNTHDLAIDDYVEDQESLIRGRIVAIQKQKVTMITEDGLTVSVAASRLDVIPPPSEKPKKVPTHFGMVKKAPSSINVIGQRYEEAKLAIMAYHDQAILSQTKTIKIIHGFGSGTLRKLVFDYFSKQEGVLKISGPEGEQAGYGVTMVTFK